MILIIRLRIIFVPRIATMSFVATTLNLCGHLLPGRHNKRLKLLPCGAQLVFRKYELCKTIDIYKYALQPTSPDHVWTDDNYGDQSNRCGSKQRSLHRETLCWALEGVAANDGQPASFARFEWPTWRFSIAYFIYPRSNHGHIRSSALLSQLY